MPLNLADLDVEMIIKSIKEQGDAKRFLESLGFVVGAAVRVVSKIQGSIIVDIMGTRVAIDKKMAGKILV